MKAEPEQSSSGRGGMADAADSKSVVRKDVGVQVSPPAPISGGEGGITGVCAAIAAAIADARGLAGGVTRLPATPQRIKALTRAATIPERT